MDATNKLPQQDTLTALQGLLERQTERTDELRRQLRMISESMKAILENDTQLSEAAVLAEHATKQIKERKKSLTESPEYRQHRTKSVEMKDELKELEESLNNNLLSYYQQTGVKTFDTTGGEQREFRIHAKVLPKKKGGGNE